MLFNQTLSFTHFQTLRFLKLLSRDPNKCILAPQRILRILILRIDVYCPIIKKSIVSE